jgi:hypothetical protein
LVCEISQIIITFKKHKMRQLILFLLQLTFLFSMNHLSAQATVDWGEEMKGARGEPTTILGSHGNHTFVMASRYSDGNMPELIIHFQRFDREYLNLQLEKKIKVPKRAVLKAFELLKDKILNCW